MSWVDSPINLKTQKNCIVIITLCLNYYWLIQFTKKKNITNLFCRAFNSLKSMSITLQYNQSFVTYKNQKQQKIIFLCYSYGKYKSVRRSILVLKLRARLFTDSFLYLNETFELGAGFFFFFGSPLLFINTA